MSGERELSCAFVRAQLPMFVGGDLLPAVANSVRPHLRSCPACRGEASAYLQALRGLQGVAAVVPPSVDEAFFCRQQVVILQAIEADAASAAPTARGWFKARWRQSSVMASACLLFALGFWGFSRVGANSGLVGRAPIPGGGARPALPVSFDRGQSGRDLQPLGHEIALDEDSGAASAGWMGRLDLRTLEAEVFLPVRHPDRGEGKLQGEQPDAEATLPPCGGAGLLDARSRRAVPDDGKPRRR